MRVKGGKWKTLFKWNAWILSAKLFRMYKNRYHPNILFYQKCELLYFHKLKKTIMNDWLIESFTPYRQSFNDVAAGKSFHQLILLFKIQNQVQTLWRGFLYMFRTIEIISRAAIFVSITTLTRYRPWLVNLSAKFMDDIWHSTTNDFRMYNTLIFIRHLQWFSCVKWTS